MQSGPYAGLPCLMAAFGTPIRIKGLYLQKSTGPAFRIIQVREALSVNIRRQSSL